MRIGTGVVLAGLLLAPACHGPARGGGIPMTLETASPAEVITALYAEVTFEAGAGPDWDVVRALFDPDAVIVLRTSRDESTRFTLDGFVADFVAFIERADAERTGFSERILSMELTEFGDLAHALVLYEAHLPRPGRSPSQGVDSIQLSRHDGRWRIVSIVNELPAEGRPLPDALLGAPELPSEPPPAAGPGAR